MIIKDEAEIPEGSVLIKTIAALEGDKQVWRTPDGEVIEKYNYFSQPGPQIMRDLTYNPKGMTSSEYRDLTMRIEPVKKTLDSNINFEITSQWEVISKVKLSSTGEDPDFNITKTYDQYKLEWWGIGNSNGPIQLVFNDDTSTKYFFEVSAFDAGDKNTTVSSVNDGGGSASMKTGYHKTSYANNGYAIISEFSTGTNKKTVYGLGGCGPGVTYMFTGLYNHNVPLTKITFNNDFTAGAIVVLMGRDFNIKK